jgi:hypothetical protein
VLRLLLVSSSLLLLHAYEYVLLLEASAQQWLMRCSAFGLLMTRNLVLMHFPHSDY